MEYTNQDFDIKKLGSFCSLAKTTFRVFAPESEKMYVVIGKDVHPMKKKKLTFEATLLGNYECKPYHYMDENGNNYLDPFAYHSNKTESIVLNPKKFIKEKIVIKEKLKPIIYETNVRDFSCAESFPYEIKRKFLSYTKTGLKMNDYFMLGIDYLKNLGITYLQFMPIFDYDKDNSDYNWGYNPKAYNYLYPKYVLNTFDPYSYVNEFRQTVNFLHSQNIKVVLDVVFNHVYKQAQFDLGRLIPKHVYRFKKNGTYANGSFCGNEIKSEDPFMRAYFVEMVKRYIEIYDIDGIRMDLMGLLDYQTVNEIKDSCRILKPDFVVYGEGWNMGDVLPEKLRASLNNADKCRDIGMFNDYFRQTFIKAIVDEDIDINAIKLSLTGENNNLLPSQSINYVECHDNNTFFDRLMLNNKHDTLQLNIAKSKLALTLVMIAKGIPFIHAGQEFLRTKHLIENSYNKSEDINKIDWYRRVEYNVVCDYFKDLCTLRKKYDFDGEVSFIENEPILEYRNGNIVTYINLSKENKDVEFMEAKHIIFDENGLCDKQVKNICVQSFSVIVFIDLDI